MIEKWRSIKETQDIYEVSTFGRIRRAKPSQRYGFSPVGHILAPGVDNGGYYLHILSCNGRRITRTVHRLVLETFIGPCPKGHNANHRDGNKGNNRLDNLEWVTLSENHIHARRVLKRRCGWNKIPYADYLFIKLRYSQGQFLREIASSYHVTPQSIFKIIHNRNTFKP